MLALSSGLLAVLATQWLHHYGSVRTGTVRERAFIRHYRREGFDKWKVAQIIGFLPVILHISVLLFLAGLVVWLYPLHVTLARVALALGATITILYIATASLAIFYPQCPYQTQIPLLLQQLRRGLAITVVFILRPTEWLLPQSQLDHEGNESPDSANHARKSSRMCVYFMRYLPQSISRIREGLKQLWESNVNVKETERRSAFPVADTQDSDMHSLSAPLLEWLLM